MIGRRLHDDAQSFDDALNGRSAKDAQIAELVRFAEGLCEAAAVQPAPAFRDSLRAQLMAEAATTLVAAPATTPARRPVVATDKARPARRRAAALTAALVTSAGAVGLVASSASAVPGQMLYPVKRSVESAELVLHRGDASRGSFQLAQASERLAEARALSADDQSPALIAESLDDFADSATKGSGSLFADFSSSGADDSVQQVNDFAAESSRDLSELSAQLPAGLDDSLAAASSAVADLARQAATLCSSCGPVDLGALASGPVDPTKAPAAAPSRATALPLPAAARPKSSTPSSTATAKTPTGATSPTTAPPSTAPTPASPLAPVTDPLLGGLLGDEDQVGLVPGLVNGLLGTTPTK
jgi:hypothetical protein